MENCLVTKLTSSVNNLNLDRLGTLIVRSKDTSGINLKIKSSSDVKISSPNGGKVKKAGYSTTPSGDWVSELTILASTMSTHDELYGVCVEANKIYYIESKYGIQGLFLIHNEKFELIKTTDLMSIPNLENINFNIKGKLEDLSGLTELVNLSPNFSSTASLSTPLNEELEGKLYEIRTLTDLETINFESLINIKGELCFLGSLTNLTSVLLRGCSGITGSIEDFVAAQRGAGRTTGSIALHTRVGTDSKITFDGGSSYTAAQTTLSWDSTHITFDGTEIENDDVISASALEGIISVWREENETDDDYIL